MTADAAHVAAVAEAREQHETWWSFVWQTYRCRGCDWRDDDPARRDEHLATVAVETLTPLIRAQVADEIEAYRRAWLPNPEVQAWLIAVRDHIAGAES